MIREIYRRALIPAFESGWHRRPTFRYLRSLHESQWHDVERLRDDQFAGMRRLLSYASEHCPYYRETWQTMDRKPKDIEDWSDFRKWPVIDRETIRSHRSRMQTTAPDVKLISKATGGSSGVPLRFDLDLDSNDRRMAAWHRGYGWAGAGLGTKQFYLWGTPIGRQPWKSRAKDAIYHAIYRRKLVSCFDLDEERAASVVEQLGRHRPEAIIAYTHPIYDLARYCERRGLRPYSPDSIVVGAEKLHDFQRECIERVFEAPVFETYGSREFMLIGSECDRHAGLHLTMEHLLVEVLDDDGHPTPEGEEGDLVITDLTNFGMPFIRYRNGDRAIAGFSHCSCGRGLPLLRKIVGRRLDTIRTADDRWVPGEYFPHFLKDFPCIARFQVVQWETDDVELKVVLHQHWEDGQEDRIRRETQSLLGESTRFRITEVDDIPLTGAGKLRVVISHCDHATIIRPTQPTA